MSASINGILLIIVLLLLVVATIAVLIGSRAGKSSSRAPTPSASGGAASPAATTTTPASPTPPYSAGSGVASGWNKFGWLVFTVAIISGGVIGIYWGVQTIDQGMPEKKEFSGYYHYDERNLSGSYSGHGPVLANITPNEIRFGFVSPQGGNVSMRWSRGGDGVWTRFFGGNSFGSWLRIKNVSNNPENDFKEWQTRIIAEVGDDTDPAKSYKVSLIR